MGNMIRPATVGKILAILAGALVFGCAPPPPSSTMKNPSSLLKAISKSTAAEDAQWRCPTSDNVTLKDNIVEGGWDYSENHSFRVCVHRDNPAKIKISGTTSWTAICAYPMSASNLSVVDTPQCAGINGNPIVITFKENSVFNYMTIVDMNHTNALNECLSGPSPCPSHAEGFVQ